MARLMLAAPISGWVVSLDEVPDAAFAERMVGDGAAIDPIDTVLRAPCDAVVTSIAAACHAVTLRAGSGVELLLHVGIDTVGLNGEGFTVVVEQGARVRCGDPLLELELDRLARGGAKSLVTPVVVIDAPRFAVTLPAANRIVRAGEPFLEIEIAEVSRDGGSPVPPVRADAAGEVTVHLPHGFHARPAARVARLSGQFTSRVVLSAHGREADAGSAVAVMGLGVGAGDRVGIRAFGDDAEAVVRALVDGIGSGFGELRERPKRADAAPCRDARTPPTTAVPGGEARGAGASRGFAIGVAWQLEEPELDFREPGVGVDAETARLEEALRSVRERLRQLCATAADDTADILSAHGTFLDDPGLLEAAAAAIRDGKSAAYAWSNAMQGARQLLESTGDSRLAERVTDLRDVEAQVLQALAGSAGVSPNPPPDSAIVLADELFPSQLARLDLSKVAGFCSAGGGPTSHVALLAASLGIPAVVGAGAAILAIRNGTNLLLDADAGRLVVEPGEEELARVRGNLAQRRRRRAHLLEQAREDCYTADGRRIRVYANLASTADALSAVAAGAEGGGLLRTEFLFQDRTAAPSRDEQVAAFQAIADALAPRPLVIRLLDAGGDKRLPYLPLPAEENPLLGLRGLRVLFRFPELLRDQLAAILEVDSACQCRILLPMVTEAGEIGRVRAIVEELAGRKSVDVGAMIETPASVALAKSIARAADFLSIGTNDLAQYTLAMDRTHPALAGTFDYFHPAVLHQVAAVCEAGSAAGRDVSVCGALASEPAAVPVLIGLGAHTLSAVPAMIPEVKQRIRSLSFTTCRELAVDALAQEDAGALRRLVDDFAESMP